MVLGTYAVVFDSDGVPVWWDDGVSAGGAGQPAYAEFLSSTTVALSEPNEFELVGLNGAVQGTVGGGSVPLDSHDLELLPNGNYLGIERVSRSGVDLSSWGLSSDSTIIDDDIVELTPAGQVVWQWSSADHIDVAIENANWHSAFPDVFHMNSIQYDGNGGIIVSYRHLDAVYRIDMATGAITWKLAGTPTPESLTIKNSPYPTNFSGQHYARLLPNGAVDRPRRRDAGGPAAASPTLQDQHHEDDGKDRPAGDRFKIVRLALLWKCDQAAKWRMGRRVGCE